MAQNCVTNARRPCGLPRVRVAGLCCRVVLPGCVAGLCCRAKWSGWDAGLVGCAGPLLVSLGSGPPARLPHARLRLGVVDLEARPGLAATRRHRGHTLQATRYSGLEWLISRLVLALPPPAATAAWLRRPRGPAAWPSDWLLGAQGACKSRAAPVSGGLCVLDGKLSSGWEWLFWIG